MDDVTPKRRKFTRVKACLAAECLVDGRVYKASTANLHPEGICIYTTPRLPADKRFRLRCSLQSGTQADFLVEERHRKSFKAKNRSYLKVGLKVVARPDNTEIFFDELSEQLASTNEDTGNLKSPSKARVESQAGTAGGKDGAGAPLDLPMEGFAVVGNALHQCLGIQVVEDRLRILAPLDFPESEGYGLNLSDSAMNEVAVQVRELGRRTINDAQGNRHLQLEVALENGGPQLHAYLQRHGLAPSKESENRVSPSAEKEEDNGAAEPPGGMEPEEAIGDHDLDMAFEAAPDLDDTVSDGDFEDELESESPPPGLGEETTATERDKASITNAGDPYQLTDSGMETSKPPQKDPAFVTNPQDPYNITDPEQLLTESNPPEEDETVSNSSSESLTELISKRKYQYRQKLGEGGFAEVYLVKDLALDRKVAMKILNPKYADNYELSQRFIAEAQIAAKFHHPNIALVYEVGVFEAHQYDDLLAFPEEISKRYPNRMAYFTMQYIEGQTLTAINKAEARSGQMQTLKILYEVGKALEFAHKMGVVHRDIKPENIMVTYDGQVLVTDFGIAKVLMDQRAQPEQDLSNQTGPNQTVGFLGTPHYVSPEQAEGEPVDGRSDIYSLGITAYEMLTGAPPFQAERWIQVLTKHIHEEPKPLREIDPGIHPNVAEFIEKCLEKDPENRYQTARDMLKAVEHLIRILEGDPFKFEIQQEVDDEARNLVKELFLHFGRSFKTIGTYPENHEMVAKTSKSLHQLFASYFERFERMDLEIDSMQVIFQRISVYQEDQRENSFCFNLYRDGIRSLSFFRGFTLEEMKTFMSRLYRYIHEKKTFEKDSVTLLFQMGLKYVDFEYVDSFYEGHDHSNQLKQIENQLRHLPKWSVESLARQGISLDKMIPFFDHMKKSSDKLDRSALTELFDGSKDAAIRMEAVRVALSIMENETHQVSLDRQYVLMEEIIHHSLREKDLKVPLLIVRTLDRWAQNEPTNDSRHFRRRWNELRQKLSDPSFLDALVDMFFNWNREVKDEIREICRYLDPQLALPAFFQQFTHVQEEWKKIFLSDLCVAITDSAPQLLIDKTKTLSDELTATLIHSFRHALNGLPKSAFNQWMGHPGTKTRLILVRELTQLDRQDSFQFIKQAALDPSPKYHHARQEAWVYLDKQHPREFSKILPRFYEPAMMANLTGTEKKLLFAHIANPPLAQNARTFLIGLVNDNQADLEERKRAAFLLHKVQDPEGVYVIGRIAKKMFGNREFTQYCRQLLKGGRP